jgi:hypothetical protein
MPLLILENSHTRAPIIFFGELSWQRATKSGSSDDDVTWLARTPVQRPVRHRGLTKFLEEVSRKPGEVTTIDDAPELSDDDTAVAEWTSSQLAILDAEIVQGKAQYARGKAQCKDGKLQMGRALNREKKILGHGKFQRHVEEVLGSTVSLRTAQRYMKLARKHDAQIKSDKLSFLKSGSDDGALNVKRATEDGKNEVNSTLRKQKVPKHTIYKLPLLVWPAERKAFDELQGSPGWPEARESVNLVLRRFCANQGIEIGTIKEEA